VIAGDTVVKLISIQTTAGVAASYADKTAFLAATHALTWRDVDGTALSTQPTWTISDEGAGVHRVRFTVPAGIWWVEPTVASGYRFDPHTWSGEGQSHDSDSIAGLLQTAQGVPSIISAADGDLGDVVEGDSFDSGALTVPLGKISNFGYSTLTGMTLSAAAKLGVTGTAIPLTGCSIVSATGRTVKLAWTSFPSGLLLDSDEAEQTVYLDLQLKQTGNSHVITPLRYTMRIVWERDET